MNESGRRPVVRAALPLLVLTLLVPARAGAQSGVDVDTLVLGIKLSVGGRYDNVRMCVASPPGVKGGPAMDVSFFMQFGLKQDVSLTVNVPIMRPIIFGAAFNMLQFEPEVTLGFRHEAGEKIDLIVGPTLGLSFHYGPDYTSSRSGPGRGPSFFAMGPGIGAYMGLDFKRPGERFNFQLGLHPYATYLFGLDDDGRYGGIVLGGTLDALFRFSAEE